MKKLKVNARTVGIIAVVAALLIGAVYLNVPTPIGRHQGNIFHN